MSRPYDWSPLGLAGDPTPGDPVVVRSGGVHYQNVSGSLGRATATMEVMDAGVSSGSQSVAALLEGSVELAAQIAKAKARYQAAGDALVNYSYALDRAQSATAQALATAKSAQWEVDENTRLAAQYRRWALDADTPEQAEDKARYQRLESARRLDVANAQARVTTQQEVVAQAVRERDVAAELAVTQISEITASDGLDDSWWDDWGAKVVAWITDLAEAIATIAGILALLVCWIPIIGQALAGVLTLISAVAGIIAALGNIALAATGERTWGEAILSIIGAALGCIGLGALRGSFGALQAGMGAWKTAGGLAGLGGLRGLGATALGQLRTSIMSLTRSAQIGPSDGLVGGGSGPWVPNNARPAMPSDGVVPQMTNGACLSAAGEMATDGAVSQRAIWDELGDWSDEVSLSRRLTELTGQDWHGGLFPSADAAITTARQGPLVVTLRMQSGYGHAVFMSPLGDDLFRVLDPWDAGSVYDVGVDWVGQFVSGGVFS